MGTETFFFKKTTLKTKNGTGERGKHVVHSEHLKIAWLHRLFRSVLEQRTVSLSGVNSLMC